MIASNWLIKVNQQVNKEQDYEWFPKTQGNFYFILQAN